VKLDNGVVPYAPRSPPRLTVFNRHSLFHNPVICVQRLTGWSSTSQPLSRHILLIDILNLIFTVYRIYFNPYFTLLGCNTRLHGVPSAWVFVSGMLAEAKVSPSFLKTPLILRDRVPSFVRMLPPVLRPACLRFSRSAYLRFLLRPVASCPRPTCLRFSRPSLPPLKGSYLQPKRAY